MSIAEKKTANRTRAEFHNSQRTELRPGIEDLAGRLMTFGLSRNEALLYVHLVALKQSSAGILAKATGIHRVDVYRLLRRLAEKQTVDVILGDPKIYIAKSPETVLRNLFEIKQRDLTTVRTQLTSIADDLDNLSKRGSKSSFLPANIDTHDFRLSYGRSNYITDVTDMTENSKKELLIVMTFNSIKRAFSTGTVDLWSKKLAQGLSIKIIINKSSNRGKEAKQLSKLFNTRSSSSAIMRLTIFDESSVLLCATDDVDLSISNPSDVYLKTTDARFSQVMKLLFDHMWKNSKSI
jgi:sugar-specific transcriptional regulator TrmB